MMVQKNNCIPSKKVSEAGNILSNPKTSKPQKTKASKKLTKHKKEKHNK